MPHTLEVNGKPLVVSKILCLARNYAEHAKEMGGRIPTTPVFFLKPPSCLLPGGGEIRMPTDIGRVDVETELVAILGRGGHDLTPSEAMACVAGYAVFFDITGRDLQGQARKEGQPWAAAKGYDTFGPISAPVTADAVRDPHDLPIRLRVNGTLRQDSNTKYMVFRIPETLAAISRVMRLEPGDLLATGTPEGVWPIVPGDVLDAEIPSVGTLRCTVAARKP
ncbi:MAG TPA: fumarylacetoacetate hydrolase family protein [Thermoplasmata archaeon]|nr:fumarylacetoacetate hydrolase family protein [Thermoplasmata archaeon]